MNLNFRQAGSIFTILMHKHFDVLAWIKTFISRRNKWYYWLISSVMEFWPCFFNFNVFGCNPLCRECWGGGGYNFISLAGQIISKSCILYPLVFSSPVQKYRWSYNSHYDVGVSQNVKLLKACIFWTHGWIRLILCLMLDTDLKFYAVPSRPTSVTLRSRSRTSKF